MTSDRTPATTYYKNLYIENCMKHGEALKQNRVFESKIEEISFNVFYYTNCEMMWEARIPKPSRLDFKDLFYQANNNNVANEDIISSDNTHSKANNFEEMY